MTPEQHNALLSGLQESKWGPRDVARYAKAIESGDWKGADRIIADSIFELLFLGGVEAIIPDGSYTGYGGVYRLELDTTERGLRRRRHFDGNGALRCDFCFKGDLKHGLQIQYDEKGRMVVQEEYADGLPNGWCTGYKPNGEVAYLRRYTNGAVDPFSS
jgi:hypothetical protein